MTRAVRVLVVEDHYAVAIELSNTLVSAGFAVIGPVGSVDEAMTALTEGPDIALLDINLRGRSVFPVADRLIHSQTPFVFTSGYGADMLPPAYRNVPRLDKPVDFPALFAMLAELLAYGTVSDDL